MRDGVDRHVLEARRPQRAEERLRIAERGRLISEGEPRQVLLHRPRKDLHHQGGFSGSGDPGDRDQHAGGEIYVEPGEVVPPDSMEGDAGLARSPPAPAGIHGHTSAEILPGEGLLIACYVPGRTHCDDFSSAISGSRPHVHQVIRGLDHLAVMLNHHDGIAGGLELCQAAKEPPSIPFMQANGRFIQDIDGSGEAVAKL